MKMVLIHLNPKHTESNKHTPLGVTYLAGYAREYGSIKDIVIADREDPVEKVSKEKPDVVGISSTSSAFPAARKVAAELKKLNIPTICGGNHLTTLPQAFCNSPFDLAVLGEGEQTLLELIQLFEKEGGFPTEKLKKIKGIMYHDNNKVKTTERRPFIENLDSIPFPARDLLDMKYYLQPRREAFSDKLVRCLQMITTRGCPYNCVFCPTQKLWGSVRFHSPEYVVNEISYLIDKYKVDSIRIHDDTFTINKKRLYEIVELIKKERINDKVEFYVYGRANLIDGEICHLLREMNVAHISFGFESGSQKILKYLKGGNVTVEDNWRAIKLCKEFDMAVQGFFIVGSPHETERDLRQTMNMVSDKRIDYAYVLQLTPYPSTALWEELKRKGADVENMDFPTPEYYNPKLVLTNEVSGKEFKKWYDRFQSICQEKWFSKPIKFQLKYFKYMLSPKFISLAAGRWKQIIKYLTA